MTTMDVESLTPHTNNNHVYPAPLSTFYRASHNLLYIIGGTTFFIGSFFYYPEYENLLEGAWWFIVGSIAFFLADITEWWTNNRVGCFYSSPYQVTYDAYCRENNYPAIDTCYGKFRRMELGLNFFLSATGSFLYIVGSVLLIPILALNDGNIIYILASLVIMIAQTWKVIRQGLGRNNHRSNWHVDNYQHDFPGLVVDICAGLGGFGYFVGSIYFLYNDDLNAEDADLGATFFVLGGGFFTLSGVAMFFRYFIAQSYK